MPSARDYLIATLMGEANREPAAAQQAILDVIANRQEMRGYGRGEGTVQAVVTENNGKGRYQFDTWRPNDNSYVRATKALQGPGQMSGTEIAQYERAAKVVDDFMTNGIGRGVSQGATYYQAPYASNKWQKDRFWGENGGNNYVEIGGHLFTGEKFVKDAGAYQAANPQFFNGQYKSA